MKKFLLALALIAGLSGCAANTIKSLSDSDAQKIRTIEIVTYGPGLHMLRSDTSPVKARISALALEQPQITFSACGNTQERMAQAEGKPIPLMTEAQVQKSGVVRLMQLQAKGYAYVKP